MSGSSRTEEIKEAHKIPKPWTLGATINNLCQLFQMLCPHVLSVDCKEISHNTSVNFCLTINGHKQWHGGKFCPLLSPSSFLTDL